MPQPNFCRNLNLMLCH